MFAATKYICEDKHTFVATKEVFWRDKHVFGATKVSFAREEFWRDKIMFCRDKSVVARGILLSRQKLYLRQLPLIDSCLKGRVVPAQLTV